MRLAVFAAALMIATAARAAGPQDVANLAWMAGVWRVTDNGVVTRETWLPPLDGAMSGVTQTTRPAKAARFEFSTITVEPAGVTFTAYLKGQPPTPFVLKSSADGEAVFENLAHDFPQRVIYRRCGVDLCGSIEGLINGKARSETWRYVRVTP